MSIQESNICELGTKEYWENAYKREIKNYKSNGDVGEIWFDLDSQDRIINWISNQDKITLDSKIIDLGCGNGMFLIEMSNKGYKHLLGIDYSPKALHLASNIAKDQNHDITYKEVDLFNVDESKNLGTFDIVHDKGTYDAISYSPKEKRALYMESVQNMLETHGLFIITSCNWTEEDLIISFNGKFEKLYTIPTPTFKFGGKVGSVITSMVFKKIAD